MSHNTRKDDVVVVACAPSYSFDLSLSSSHTSEIQTPIFFQLDDLYNINNIIISEIIILSEEEYIDEEYVDEEEYIDSKNDPYSVEKIIEEDTLIVSEEKIVEFDKVICTVSAGRSEESLARYDHIMEEKVLDSLRRGKLK